MSNQGRKKLTKEQIDTQLNLNLSEIKRLTEHTNQLIKNLTDKEKPPKLLSKVTIEQNKELDLSVMGIVTSINENADATLDLTKSHPNIEEVLKQTKAGLNNAATLLSTCWVSETNNDPEFLRLKAKTHLNLAVVNKRLGYVYKDYIAQAEKSLDKIPKNLRTDLDKQMLKECQAQSPVREDSEVTNENQVSVKKAGFFNSFRNLFSGKKNETAKQPRP